MVTSSIQTNSKNVAGTCYSHCFVANTLRVLQFLYSSYDFEGGERLTESSSMSFVRVEAQKQLLVATTGDSLGDHFYKKESGNITHNSLEFGSALGLLLHSSTSEKPLETLCNFGYLPYVY